MLDSPEWLALCQAVVQQPEDDLPRLLAADWLEEHSQAERAEYIRVQLELAKEPTPALHWRERSLWNQPVVGALWALDLCPQLLSMSLSDTSGTGTLGLVCQPLAHLSFERGFPHAVRTTAMQWLDHGGELIPQYPVRVVQLNHSERPIEADWWRLAGLLEGVSLMEFNGRVNLAERLRGRLESAGVIIRVQNDRVGSSLRPLQVNTGSDRERLQPPRPMLPAG